jgi:copper(I)-binding protein
MQKFRYTWLACGLAALALMFLAACGTQPAAEGEGTVEAGITVNEPWVRSAVMLSDTSETMDGGEMEGTDGTTDDTMDGMDHGSGSNSAAYMVLQNESDTPDALIAANTDAAETVELHTVVMENNVMMMRPVEQIDIPASGETELRPGGFHVMLLGINRDLAEGDTVDLTLTFEHAGDISITAPVRQGGSMDMEGMNGGEMDGGEMDGGEMDGGEMDGGEMNGGEMDDMQGEEPTTTE